MKHHRSFTVAAAGALVVALVIIASAAAPPGRKTGSTPAVADSGLGLSRTSVFSVPAPPRVVPEAGAPGDRPRRARAYPTAPPQVPHGIADFLPITRTENMCIDCHSRAGAEESGAVVLPNSHYTDLRNDPGRVGEQVAGARYLCVSCHATGSDAKPLVGNGRPRS